MARIRIGVECAVLNPGEKLFTETKWPSARLQIESVTVMSFETPAPATLPLFATGLGAFGLLGWRRKRTLR